VRFSLYGSEGQEAQRGESEDVPTRVLGAHAQPGRTCTCMLAGKGAREGTSCRALQRAARVEQGRFIPEQSARGVENKRDHEKTRHVQGHRDDGDWH
jgi:hypothetical protein